MQAEQIALTGASGMLGTQVLNVLTAAGISVKATSRSQPAFTSPLVTWQQWDFESPVERIDLNAFFDGCTALVHAGALVPNPGQQISAARIIDVNVRVVALLAEWATLKKIPMIYISGATVYTDPFQLKIPESAPTGGSPYGGFYGYSKFLAEKVLDFFRTQGLELTILRPSSIYGPGQSDEKLIPRFIKSAATGEPISLQPPYHERVNLVYAGDVAEVILKVLQGRPKSTLNVAYSRSYSFVEIASVIETALRAKGIIIPQTDRSQLYEEDRSSPCRFDLSTEKLKAELCFEPLVSLEAGVSQMLAHYCF